MENDNLTIEVDSSTTFDEGTSEKTPETEPIETEPVETEPVEDEISKTKAFSERLKAARKKDTEEIERLTKLLDESNRNADVLMNAVKGYGYEGTAQEMADALVAAAQQTTPEQVRAEREAQEKAIEEAIARHPSVLAAQKLLEETKVAQTQALLAEDLRQIQKLNPEIKAISDLSDDPNADLIRALVQSGKRYHEAYREVLELRQGKVKKADTKEHLKGIGGTSAGDTVTLVEIPDDELPFLKKAFPNLPYAQLREKYNNILKRQEG